MICYTAKAKSDRGLVNGKTGIQLVWEYLEKHGLDKYISKVTAEKPRAVAYIDDKAFTWGSLDGTGTGSSLSNTNHYLYADPKVSARSAHTWTAGINWYLNPEVKFALNYARTSFKGGAGSIGGSNSSQAYNLITQNSVIDREDESVLLARFQIAY